jgi:Zn finger protein HypA/HybF involved in hydrogenase expression
MALIRMMADIITWVCHKCHTVEQTEGFHGAPKCPKCGAIMFKK